MFDFFQNLDKRWVFLSMVLAVTGSILFKVRPPEKTTPMVEGVFKTIDSLPEGSKVWAAWDYDPSTQGELQPMASAFTRHCAIKKHKIYFMTLLPQGGPMLSRSERILKEEFEYKYGEDYVILGFRPGNEGVIKVVVSDMKELFGNDTNGTDLDEIPLTAGMKNMQGVDLIVNVSGADPGTKQWVQYASTPFGIKTVAGTTGVQAPPLYAYIPNQLSGILAAIKGAAEYEQLLIEKYPELKENDNAKEGLRRMGPQLVAHLLMVLLIVAGNVIFFVGRARESAQRGAV